MHQILRLAEGRGQSQIWAELARDTNRVNRRTKTNRLEGFRAHRSESIHFWLNPKLQGEENADSHSWQL